MNAIDFLTKEHDRVRIMLADIADESHRWETQKNLFDDLAKDLTRHEHMEHEVWYPHFKDKLPDEVKHLVSEEKHAETEIKNIKALKTEAAWKTHFLKFKSDVAHHADEEEGDLFPEVAKILSEKELEAIGSEMFAYKQKHS